MYLSVLSLSLALAAPLNTVTLADVCEGYALTRRVSDGAIVVRCPGQVDPWLVLPQCKGKTPRVSTDRDKKYGYPRLTIDCSK